MIHTDELSKNANGGTEMMKRFLENNIEVPLLEKVQIVVSRERELLPNLPAIFWAHDLAEDPEAIKALGNGAWQKYAKIVCVSHWQKEKYISAFAIPPSRITVIQNGIEPFGSDVLDKWEDLSTIRLIYHTTPHRGLALLYHAVNELSKHFSVHLDVFSSFEAYGWSERDEPFRGLFKLIDEHENMTNHGYQPNSVIRDYLKNSHLFAYPNIWQETSGISLIEAMSSCTHIIAPTYAAIPETTGNLSTLYDYKENESEHLVNFYSVLYSIMNHLVDGKTPDFALIKNRADTLYNLDLVKFLWTSLISDLTKTN